jgi:hypothetical protein
MKIRQEMTVPWLLSKPILMRKSPRLCYAINLTFLKGLHRHSTILLGYKLFENDESKEFYPNVSSLNQERSSNTEPPPTRIFSATVNQFSIFDAYMEDVQQKEKAAKEKTKVRGLSSTQLYSLFTNTLYCFVLGRRCWWKRAQG